jgi:hypothetical protein
MPKETWCRHYNGVGNSKTCKIGVLYESVRDASVRPNRFPCYDPVARDNCSKYEGYTAEEIAADEAQLQTWISNFNAFMQRETEDCPQCHKPVTGLSQVGRCVYARPCGCRVCQGQVPKAWKA